MTVKQYLQVLLLLQASWTNGDEGCDIVYDDQNTCLLKELIIMIDHSGNQLAVDQRENILYLSLDHGRGRFTPAMLNINTKKLTVLVGIQDALAVAVDDETGHVYFGGSKGIYKFRGLYTRIQRLDLYLPIRWLVLRGYIYYIQSDSKAYVYRRHNVIPYHQVKNVTMNQFVFDASRNVFFINKTGLYRVSRYHDVVKLVRKSANFFGLATNNNGQVFVSAADGIYYIKGGLNLVKYVDIPGVMAMAFDKNNRLIYSDARRLVRLLAMSKNGVKASSVNNVVLVR